MKKEGDRNRGLILGSQEDKGEVKHRCVGFDTAPKSVGSNTTLDRMNWYCDKHSC